MAEAQTVVIVNPNSQNGALGDQWHYISGLIRRELAFEEVMTQGPGDATRLAREALDAGAERVVAIGGDGTINEVINGFFDNDEPVAPHAALGVLPFGTGGDFRKTIHVPKDLRKAAAILARGRTRRTDVGHLEYQTRDGETRTRVFANISSFGISGVVDRLVNEAWNSPIGAISTKKLGGRLSFMLATARAGLTYKNQRVRLVFDDDTDNAVDTTINTVAVANGRYFGGGMCIAPDAELDDGWFDVVAIGDLTTRDFLFNGYRLYNGTHLGMDKVSHRHAKKLHAEPIVGDVVELDVDGETPGVLPATFTLLPNALDLVVPA